jgi:hypothetical protein
LVRQFSPVVEAFVLPVFNARQDFALGRPVALELVGYDDPRDIAQPLEQFAKEALGGFPVTTGLHQNVERVPVLIHRPPEIVVLAADGEHPDFDSYGPKTGDFEGCDYFESIG